MDMGILQGFPRAVFLRAERYLRQLLQAFVEGGFLADSGVLATYFERAVIPKTRLRRCVSSRSAILPYFICTHTRVFIK